MNGDTIIRPRRMGTSSGTRDFACTQTWWAADARLGWWGPDGTTRLVATADPGILPDKATWYLATNLSRPGSPREAGSPHPAASLEEVVRIYGNRHWTAARRRTWRPGGHPGHVHPRCPQEADQSRAVGAGTLDREPGHRPEASQPRRRRRRFSTRG